MSFRGVEEANPESRDSGSGPADHPGMTSDLCTGYREFRFQFVDQALRICVYMRRNCLPDRRNDLDSIAYVNGSFVPLSEAKVSILDRGFLFADGIYEVAAVLGGRLVDNGSHLARLERSVGEISLKLPESLDRIVEIQKELVARNKLA